MGADWTITAYEGIMVLVSVWELYVSRSDELDFVSRNVVNRLWYSKHCSYANNRWVSALESENQIQSFMEVDYILQVTSFKQIPFGKIKIYEIVKVVSSIWTRNPFLWNWVLSKIPEATIYNFLREAIA